MRDKASGFSLIEIMVALLIFVIISAAVFKVLDVAQERYVSERQVLSSLDNARAGLQEMEQEISNAGFPALSQYSATPSSTQVYEYAIPFESWSGGAPDPATTSSPWFTGFTSDPTTSTTCTVTTASVVGTCQIPDPWALSMEEELDPYNAGCPQQVNVIDYLLVDDGNGETSTLMRRVGSKDPVQGGTGSTTDCMTDYESGGFNYTATTNGFAPFIQNIVNKYQTTPVNVFTYTTSGGSTPPYITSVTITLMVKTQSPDLQTHEPQIITLTGVVNRVNPSS